MDDLAYATALRGRQMRSRAQSRVSALRVPLEPGVIHVWELPLGANEGLLDRFQQILNEEEVQRAGRFRFSKDRARFVCARAQVRELLGEYTGLEPSKLQFQFGPNGKPSLHNLPTRLQFNLTHSKDVALLAITRTGPIGIDIEKIGPIPEMQQLVARFFSARENRDFQALAESQKTRAFFNLWTRKEAFLKATGEGIAHSLNQVEVTFLPGEPAQLLCVPDAVRPVIWNLREIETTEEYAAALVCAFPINEICRSCWQPPEFSL